MERRNETKKEQNGLKSVRTNEMHDTNETRPGNPGAKRRGLAVYCPVDIVHVNEGSKRIQKEGQNGY